MYYTFTTPSAPPLSLDPVLVAGSARMDIVIDWVEKWYPEIAPVLKGDTAFWNDRELSDANPKFVAQSYSNSMNLLQEWGIVRVSTVRREDRLFIAYFEVPKADGRFSRAIANCKAMNSTFRPQLPFRLPSVEEIVRLIDFFPSPVFMVADLRHWFHQLRLPKEWRHLFSLQQDREILEWNTWPMGFRYTPVVAQTIVVSLLCEASKNCGWVIDVDKEPGPRPVVVARSGGRISVLAVVWYDNILVAAGSETIRRRFMGKLTHLLRSARIVVKEPGFSLSVDSVTYGGAQFQPRGGSVRWQHTESNVARWRGLVDTPLSLTGREWLSRVGIISWDFRLSGNPMRRVHETFRKVFLLTQQCADNGDWTLECVGTEELAQAVGNEMERVVANSSRIRSIPPYPARKVWVASDASDWGYGFVTLDQEGLITRSFGTRWRGTEKALHINERETLAAVETIMKVVEKDTCVVLAVDNVTAAARVRDEHFEETDWNWKCIHMRNHVSEERATLRIIRVKSADNPSDAVSRGQPVPERANRECLGVFEHASARCWFEESVRRPRETVGN